MQVIAWAHERNDSGVKSFSLEDFAPPPIPRARKRRWADLSFFARALYYVKVFLVAWGVISLGAAIGAGYHYLKVEPLPPPVAASPPSVIDASDAPPAAPATGAAIADPPRPTREETKQPTQPPGASASERLAMLMDDPSSVLTAPPSPELAQALILRTSATAVDGPTPIVATRVPRARPGEPIITGSIARRSEAAKPVRTVAKRSSGPCAALRKIRAEYLFGNRCGRHARADTPPPKSLAAAPSSTPPTPAQDYAPRPYRPPVLVQD
jgi:hypothetical protein